MSQKKAKGFGAHRWKCGIQHLGGNQRVLDLVCHNTSGLCLFGDRSRSVSCCPDGTAGVGWLHMGAGWEEVRAAPRQNLHLLYVTFINNYLCKCPLMFGVICWVRGQGQIRFVNLLGKDVRAGVWAWLDDGDKPGEQQAVEGGCSRRLGGAGAVCRCCLQAVLPAGLCCQEAAPVPAIRPGCEHTEPRGHRPHP